jgi:hypothetical protein
MTSQNHQYDKAKRQEALTGEILGPLPISSNDYWTLQTCVQLPEKSFFVFLSIIYDVLPEWLP